MATVAPWCPCRDRVQSPALAATATAPAQSPEAAGLLVAAGVSESALLLAAPDPAALAGTVLSDPTVARFVQRWYVVNGAAQPTLAAAIDELERRLLQRRSAAGAGDGEADGEAEAVRIQTFPRQLQPVVVGRLQESGAALPSPRACTRLRRVHVGAFHVGVGARGARSGRRGEVGMLAAWRRP